MRDHAPVLFEKFNGYFDRGDPENTPLDHFSEANNLKFIGPQGFGTRDGIGPHQDVVSPLGNILRFYNYPTTDKNTILVLVKNGANGEIYHVIDSTTLFGPVLTIAGMFDFGFLPFAGRAYITPFITELVGALNRERGMQSQFLYVYKGDGTAARKAAGATPAGTLTVANGAAGHTDGGNHTFAVVGETDTGFLSQPCAAVGFVTSDNFSVNFTSIPTFTGSQWVKRHLVASKVIQDYNGDVTGYEFFFVPTGTINNNVATSLSNISFYDQELLDSADYLSDNFAEIAAGVGLALYHNRLVIYTSYTDVSLAYASAEGEPEAISQIDGVLLIPPDGNPITNAGELRDVLYFFKRNKTFSFVDNGDTPATWPLTTVDMAMGCGVHGLATVVDAGFSNVDYLLVSTYNGVCLFNGRYQLPELTWKIQDFWRDQTFKTDNRRIQILNDPVAQNIYIVLTDRTMLYANYANGFDPKNIRWCPWSFTPLVNTICLINVNELILGCDQV